MGATTGDDGDLVAELGRALRSADPVPAGWWRSAAIAFGWVEIDAEPGRLAYDARTRRGGQAGRGSPGREVREARYVAGGRAVSLEVEAGEGTVRLFGRVEPPRGVDVAVLWPGGRWDGRSDGHGVFRADDLPRQPLCVVVGGDPPVKSGWVVP
ncbi:MAG TPA: hypothetical protein VFZ77_17565 [Acidimicrobiales bacterium]